MRVPPDILSDISQLNLGPVDPLALNSVLPLLVNQRFASLAAAEVVLYSFGIDVLGSASGSVAADVAEIVTGLINSAQHILPTFF